MGRTWSTTALAVVIAFTLGLTVRQSDVQAQGRMNQIIEQFQQGRPAFGNEHWRLIDMEHGAVVYSELRQILAKLKPKGAARPTPTPIVRIPYEGDQDFKHEVKRILDMGAFGIVLPHTGTAEQALRFVRAMRYPQMKGSKYPEPNGVRGWNIGTAGPYWGLKSPAFEQKADLWPLNPDGELLAIVMIETREGVNNVEQIAKVPGLSGLFMGYADLGVDMGFGPPVVRTDAQRQEVDAATRRVAKACAAQKLICVNIAQPEELKGRIKEGWNTFVSARPPGA